MEKSIIISLSGSIFISCKIERIFGRLTVIVVVYLHFILEKFDLSKKLSFPSRVLIVNSTKVDVDAMQKWTGTAPFNDMRTLKFKAQPTNVFFATVSQRFGGSSQPPTTAECTVIKSLCAVQTTKQCSAVVVSWEKPPNI